MTDEAVGRQNPIRRDRRPYHDARTTKPSPPYAGKALSKPARHLWSRACSCATNSRTRSVPVLALASRSETGSSGWWSGASRPGPTGNRPPLAPTRLAALLALALRPSAGPASIESRDSGADRHHGEREPALGHRAYPRRAPQARHRGQFSLDPPLLPAPT